MSSTYLSNKNPFPSKTKKFPGQIYTVHQTGQILSKPQEGINVTLQFNQYGTPSCAEVYSDDYEEYAEIGLGWNGKTLVDYDGVFQIPQPVVDFLREEGWVVPKDFDQYENKVAS